MPKTNYPKIDIYINGIYKASTTWARNCVDAKNRAAEKFNISRDAITTKLAKDD